MGSYYNEIDPEKAQWIRELILAGVVAPGDVDERSITDVQPDDLRGYAQCHFFAGIAVWSYALRLAGWHDDREVWTGSCPCPSFSAAGKGEGFDDPRHLWPDWFRLIGKRKPATVFGEQVAQAIGYGWLDLVQAQMETENYAIGKAVLASASVGSADLRERLYFVAHSEHAERRPLMQHREDGRNRQDSGWAEAHGVIGARCEVRGMADSQHNGCDRSQGITAVADSDQPGIGILERDSATSIMGHATGHGQQAWEQQDGQGDSGTISEGRLEQSGACTLGGFWRDAEWIYCRDEKYRPVEPGTFPLAHGVAGRVLKLRGYGDAINAQVAKTFIEAFQEVSSHVPG